ncbi:hypothetical protein [Salibacter sp.]|uniref:hypothetical protein n=1 Tax=Salibacter sp. TaxID=2010995 RepID=UPI00286FBA88|nr:hypothetical protein [Salibacter sp.]MDR9488586.1 hypothetical protein [Salibacter sp.]
MEWRKIKFIVITALVIAVSSCQTDDDAGTTVQSSPNSPDSDKYIKFLNGLYNDAQAFHLEVAYQSDAEPFSQSDDWNLTAENMQAVFDERPITPALNIPDTVRSVASGSDRNFTPAEIVDLADQHRKRLSTKVEPSVFVIFLDGYLEQDGEVVDKVVGVNISNTSVVAVFRPVIDSVGTTELQKRNIEQATLVHEIGHAIGLVNKGVPLTADHLDPEHEKHCINEDCVMYFENEVSGNMADFITGNLTPQDRILFKEDCLTDISGY